jgi:membrane-associated phospholipid phosphatase
MSFGYLTYYLFLIVVGGVFFARIRQEPLPFRRVMTASVLAYMICYIVFLLFPTEGPAHTLALQHTRPLSGGMLYATVLFLQKGGGVHGNAFPSAHVAGAVAALGIAWLHRPRLALALTPFALLLCLGAVYARYHYVSDVIAGILVGALAALAVCKAPRHWLSES